MPGAIETSDFNENARAWLTQTTGIASSDLYIEKMKGSSSSSIFLVRHASDETAAKFVLRVLDNEKWLAEEPDILVHDAAALTEAQKIGVTAPQCVAYSEENIGFGAPALLMSHLTGRIELLPADFAAWIEAQARTLARIHAHQAEGFPWQYETWVNREYLTVPAWTTKPDVWQRALDFWLAGAPAYAPSFLHRDYHPVNLLWEGDQISGVVDWVNACWGPAGVDIGHCRANLICMYGLDAANQFLAAYQNAAPDYVYDPYWDVDTVFDGLLPAPEFYVPWLDFGLEFIPPETLQARLDAYLESVMRHVE
jgi:aminoglycoside phosphotransferase (APT) family kinase protein